MTTRIRRKPLVTRKRKQRDLSLSKVRSALTNGSRLFLGGVAETGAWCRRLRDLQFAYEADLGGVDNLSEGQRTIVHRLAMLTLQSEMLEMRFAQNEGEASGKQLDLYQRTSNSARRLAESLGLHKGRQARDITPVRDTYMLDLQAQIREEKAEQAAKAAQQGAS